MLTRRQRTAALGAGIVSVFMCGSGISEVAAARPVRGPLLRAERRLARAQAVLEREQARPLPRPRQLERIASPRRESAGLATPPAVEPETASPSPAPSAPTAVPQAAAAGAAGDQRPTGGSNSGVARAAYEAPARREPAGGGDAVTGDDPAADGTVSVLVRDRQPSDAKPRPDQSAEPLLFPAGSAP